MNGCRVSVRFVGTAVCLVFVHVGMLALVTGTASAQTVITAGDLLARARTAAAADNHAAAIRDFRAALTMRPALEGSVARELGDQYTWAEKPDSAIVWYEAYLRHHPGDIDARLGIARALSWDDRLDEAYDYYENIHETTNGGSVAAEVGMAKVTSWQNRLGTAESMYDDILARHPDNIEARIGRAQVINWSGRHREAAALYESLLADHPDSADGHVGLANAYRWMGLNDRALDALGTPPRAKPAETVHEDLTWSLAPRVSQTFAANEDSDDIERITHRSELTFTPGPMTRAGAQYAQTRIEGPGVPDVTRHRMVATLAHRFGSLLAVTVNPGYEHNSYDVEALSGDPDAASFDDEFGFFTVDAFVTLTPRDWVRGDIGFERTSLDNPEPTYRGIVVSTVSVGLDTRFSPSAMVVTAVSHSTYSDDNGKTAGGQRLEWRPAFRFPVPFAHRFTSNTGWGYFTFRESPDRGYYSPDSYTSLYERLTGEFTFNRRLRVSAGGRIAAERENAGDWFAVGSFDGAVSVRIWKQLTLSAGYYNARSRLETEAGYKASGFYVTLEAVAKRGEP